MSSKCYYTCGSTKSLFGCEACTAQVLRRNGLQDDICWSYYGPLPDCCCKTCKRQMDLLWRRRNCINSPKEACKSLPKCRLPFPKGLSCEVYQPVSESSCGCPPCPICGTSIPCIFQENDTMDQDNGKMERKIFKECKSVGSVNLSLTVDCTTVSTSSDDLRQGGAGEITIDDCQCEDNNWEVSRRGTSKLNSPTVCSKSLVESSNFVPCGESEYCCSNDSASDPKYECTNIQLGCRHLNQSASKKCICKYSQFFPKASERYSCVQRRLVPYSYCMHTTQHYWPKYGYNIPRFMCTCGKIIGCRHYGCMYKRPMYTRPYGVLRPPGAEKKNKNIKHEVHFVACNNLKNQSMCNCACKSTDDSSIDDTNESISSKRRISKPTIVRSQIELKYCCCKDENSSVSPKKVDAQTQNMIKNKTEEVKRNSKGEEINGMKSKNGENRKVDVDEVDFCECSSENEEKTTDEYSKLKYSKQKRNNSQMNRNYVEDNSNFRRSRYSKYDYDSDKTRSYETDFDCDSDDEYDEDDDNEYHYSEKYKNKFIDDLPYCFRKRQHPEHKAKKKKKDKVKSDRSNSPSRETARKQELEDLNSINSFCKCDEEYPGGIDNYGGDYERETYPNKRCCSLVLSCDSSIPSDDDRDIY